MPVKRILATALIALGGLGAAFLWVTYSREAQYRHLIRDGQRAMAANQLFDAVEAFSGAIALKPASMLAYAMRGEAYRRRGEPTTALRDLRKAGQIDPTAVRPLEGQGDINFAIGQYAQAAGNYEAYVRLDDRSPTVLYKLALTRLQMGNPAGAVELLRAGIRLDDRFTEAYYLLGVCQAETGRGENALASLQKAIQLSPGFLPAREEMVRLLLSLGRDMQAAGQLEELAAMEESSVNPMVQAALIYARLEHTGMAVTELGRAAERTKEGSPDRARVFEALGTVWLEVARAHGDKVALEKAVEALTHAVRTPEADSHGLTLYAQALLLLGDSAGAQAAARQACERAPTDPEAYRLLAALLERQGNLAAAVNALSRYLAITTDEQAMREAALHVGALRERLRQPRN